MRLTIISIASPRVRNAFVVFATESSRSAGRDNLRGTAYFVRVIPTVILSVANPGGQNAIGRRIARNEVEEGRDIGLRVAAVRSDDVGRVARHRRTTDLVGNIGAIPSSIASVRLFHAHALLASKLSSDARAVRLVGMIPTVILPVANLGLQHATLRFPAGKELLGTDSRGAEGGILVAPVRAMTIGAVASEAVWNAVPVAAFEFEFGASDVGAIYATLASLLFVIGQ